MRILYWSIPSFADSDFPLIKALREAGHEVFYIVRLAPYLKQTTLFDIKKIYPQSTILPASVYPELEYWSDYIDLEKTYVSNDAVGKTGLKSFRLYLKEQKLIKSLNPDIIHHVGIPFIFHLMMMWKYRKKAICVMHDPLPHSSDKGLRNGFKRWALTRISPRFILLNNQQKELFCSTYKVDPAKVFIASLGPYDCYRKLKTGRIIGGQFILFYGRIAPYKGINYAIDAFCQLKCPDVRFVIAGEGRQYFDIPENSQVEFIHRFLSINEVADYVSQALFVVCPYTDATQSGVLQTALAFGTPVVATEVGNFPELISNNVNGMLVPPRDAKSLASAFQLLLENRQLLETMRSNVDNALSASISWNCIAEKYIEIYRQ